MSIKRMASKLPLLLIVLTVGINSWVFSNSLAVQITYTIIATIIIIGLILSIKDEDN